jgi:hypothetical protein
MSRVGAATTPWLAVALAIAASLSPAALGRSIVHNVRLLYSCAGAI